MDVDIREEIEDADEEDVAERAGQAGLAVRGVLYLVSAFLTVRIAFGSAPDEEGPGKQGALESVAQQPFGRVALAVLAVGLAGYAVWRFIAPWKYDGGDDDADSSIDCSAFSDDVLSDDLFDCLSEHGEKEACDAEGAFGLVADIGLDLIDGMDIDLSDL